MKDDLHSFSHRRNQGCKKKIGVCQYTAYSAFSFRPITHILLFDFLKGPSSVIKSINKKVTGGKNDSIFLHLCKKIL